MGFIQGNDCNQMTYWSLEDLVDKESMVRFIDKLRVSCEDLYANARKVRRSLPKRQARMV